MRQNDRRARPPVTRRRRPEPTSTIRDVTAPGQDLDGADDTAAEVALASDGEDALETRRSAVRHALGALSTLVPVGMFATDADGACWYVNQRLIDAVGLELHSFDERPFHLDLSDRDHPRLIVHRAGGADGAARADGTEAAVADGAELAARIMPLVRGGELQDYVGMVESVGGSEATELLHAGDNLLASLIDRSPEVMTVLNEDGTWRYSNAAAWRLLGYQADFDPSTGIVDLLHPDDVAEVVAALDRLQHGARDVPVEMEVRVRGADGSWRYLENFVENLIDDPAIHGLLLRSRDVTATREARLALHTANERLSTLIGSLHLAVLLEDAERTILVTNEAFVTLFELPLTPAELVGHTIDSVGAEFFRRFGDPTLAAARDRTATILSEQRPILGDRIVMGDGRVLERDYLPIMVDGAYHGHVWLFRDVSAQALAEAEWESLISRQRAENERLLELDRVKAAFLAEISHELRTPLTSILSFAELLTDGLGRDDPAEQKEFTEIIKRNADRLLRLVDDLLLLDRIETGAMPLEWGVVDVPSVVSACVVGLSPSAEAKLISLESEIGEGPSVPGDSGRLAQVLDILVSNAIKFTPEGGRVIVTATPVDQLWRIEVVDTGIGVPVKEQDALFERFYRATNARLSRIPGSGLGLSVAKAIAELHGGQITLRSAESAGTTVVVTVPFSRTSELDLLHEAFGG